MKGWVECVLITLQRQVAFPLKLSLLYPHQRGVQDQKPEPLLVQRSAAPWEESS